MLSSNCLNNMTHSFTCIINLLNDPKVYLHYKTIFCHTVDLNAQLINFFI